ncbi:hypothetical protein C2857_007680 [Epichloe festucae Fl1]|uniref:Fork-head domain-containing protein n=1 Tax=Epichloe festucae (strain Fl1) TaxID=877507 RepID=A0A7S9KMN1_EPIFF|nr:hypothetical protein C2857_007680 [Epichloe festucae Fl1]
MTSSSHSSDAGQDVWPSPPLAPGDLDLNYCLQDSSNPDPLGGLKSDCTYTPATPSGWYAAAPAVCSATARYNAEKSSFCQPLFDTCTPTSPGELGWDSTNGIFLSLGGEKGIATDYIWGIDVISPLSTLEASPIAWSDSVVDSPPSAGTPQDVAPTQLVEARSVPSSMSTSASTSASASPPPEFNADSSEPANCEKADEPYAKLIYKAIMSRSDHSMTLQEIYQWFRDNTNKAVTETRGWQNSIRHNLSMNAAFRKKEKPLCKTAKPASSSEDSKRVNEWVLEDWAICNGVQSTTRYRKSNYARRPASGRAAAATTNPWAPEHSAKRALSGRKGGCATRASRRRMRNYGQGIPLDNTPQPSLDFRRAYSPLPPSADVYGYDYSGAHIETMHYLALRQAYQEGLAGSCGDEATLGSRHFELPGSNFPQHTTNNSNLLRAHDTVGTYHQIAPRDLDFGPEEGRKLCVNKYRAPLACTSSSPSPSNSRPFELPRDGSHAWWHNSQYL